ncbi:MAG: DUF86 domain-containing protein [Alphaproteobacteria bacterium]|jgi:uncharacterized protein with HEPN domain|nr:DUF86 domain-containing protein [Alphaproteobacteria bacterium]MDP6815731.1 DUF86 domain-containing protein [Alphaproteobacteria bacterium]
MPFEDPAQRLDDIIDNAGRLRAYTAGMNLTDFLADRKTIDAVERCLQRIAEAARKLGDRYDAGYPELELPELRKLGSILRRDYDEVRPGLLWGFIQDRLNGLEAMAKAELEELDA